MKRTSLLARSLSTCGRMCIAITTFSSIAIMSFYLIHLSPSLATPWKEEERPLLSPLRHIGTGSHTGCKRAASD